jgi:hypothetical protein
MKDCEYLTKNALTLWLNGCSSDSIGDILSQHPETILPRIAGCATRLVSMIHTALEKGGGVKPCRSF